MKVRFENEVYDLSLNWSRKSLHEAVENYYDNNYNEREDDHLDDLETLHTFISEQDVNGLVDNFLLNGDFQFSKFDDCELLEIALIEVGYKVECSNISRSLYAINDNNEEVRISDHKRPSYSVAGNYQNHEYERELIASNNVIDLDDLIFNGFTKLTKREYILG